MVETFEYTIEIFQKYIGNGRFAILFLACLLLGFIIAREREEITFFFQYTLILAVVLLCPVTAGILMGGMGKKVYWRMLWLVPVVLVIAFVLTKFIHFVKPNVLKTILIAVFGAAIILGGNFVYQSGVYKEVPNSYKLSSDTLQIGKLVLRDAGDNEICIALSDNQAAEIRQFSSRFKQPYGRSYELGWNTAGKREEAEQVAEMMQDWHSTTEQLVVALADYGCNYVAINKRDIRLYQMHEYGCTEVGQSNTYVVFRMPDDVKPYLDQKKAEEEAIEKAKAAEAKLQAEEEAKNAEAQPAEGQPAEAVPAEGEVAPPAEEPVPALENVEG